jgi:hypothetical protein
MDKQHLIFVLVDYERKFGTAPNKVAGRELALKDGVLEMIAVPAHRLEDLAEALIVADIVTNKIRLTHVMPSTWRAGN